MANSGTYALENLLFSRLMAVISLYSLFFSSLDTVIVEMVNGLAAPVHSE